MSDHPLVPDTSSVPIRFRPRFTMTEAMILNLLVNAAPQHVTIREIQHQLARFRRDKVPMMESSVKQTMVGLRAKLGERAWDPQQVVSVTELYQKPGRSRPVYHLVGYRWVPPTDEGR